MDQLQDLGFLGQRQESTRVSMDNVVSMMIGNEQRPYACQVCNKRFTQKAHLITHKRTHTGEKPYACHICHKRFAQSSHLNTHKRIHTGEKPYYCTLCKIGYCRKQRLELHLLQHSKEEMLAANIPVPDDYENLRQEHASGNIKLEYSDSGPVFPANSLMNFKMQDLPALDRQGQSLTDSYSENDLITNQTDETGSPAMYLSHRRKPTVVNHISSTEHDNGLNNDVIENHNIKQEYVEHPLKPEQGDTSDINSIREQNDMSGSANASLEESKDESFEKVQSGCEDRIMDGQCGNADNINSGSGEDVASVTSESNLSGSELSLPTLNCSVRKRSMLSYSSLQRSPKGGKRSRQASQMSVNQMDSPQVGVNSRICLVNFTNEDLLTHMMSRDDVYRCDFCCIIFQDAAMYHLHRSMHDKMDIRCCNLCGKLAQDKYDFSAHFLSEHK